ncbi:Transposase [Streptomyces hygroscopicus subsp. limoneus]|nr:Transposase [Streptomyces hygroscopicus subsp. limoneus]
MRTLIGPLLPPWPQKLPGPRPVADRLCLPGRPVRPLQRHSLATAAFGAGVRLGTDVLAAPGTMAAGQGLRPAVPHSARGAECGRRTRLVQGVCGWLPHSREKGGADTGPSPVDRGKTGSKHHLICDGHGTPPKVITTAANVNDVPQTLPLVDGIPPVAGRPGRPRRRPESPLGEKGYDSNTHREELLKRRILPVISRKGTLNIKGLGKLRYVVGADLRLAPPVQTPRRPLGAPNRTPRHLRPVGLCPYLLETAEEGPIVIVLRALRDSGSGILRQKAGPGQLLFTTDELLLHRARA